MSNPKGEPPDRPKTQVSGRNPPPARAEPGPGGLAVGEPIDDFLLLDELGKGAFATVYLAHQQTLHRTVALKIFTDPSREAQTLAQVDHPNIVRVHDQRLVPDRNLQLLYMEYVAGGTLARVVERVALAPPGSRSGRLLLEVIDASLEHRGERPPLDSRLRARLTEGSWAEAVSLLGTHMAVALDYAHSRGVLHRDIKPANVLLDGSGRPKLADFNISSATGLDDSTDDEAVGGTLPYMAPEQVAAVSPWHAGGASDLDARTDLYGLGVVLWELLTGSLPFPEPPEEGGMQAVIEHLLDTRTAGVSEEVIAAFPPDAPPMLRDTLLSCLAPKPADRPASGFEVRRRLELCLDARVRRLLHPRVTGWHAWREWMCRWPLAGLILAVLIPNAVLSVLNTAFNLKTKIADHELDAFLHKVMVVNGIAFPVGIAIFVAAGWVANRTVRARARGAPTNADQRTNARVQALRLGSTMGTIVLPLWILGGLVFPVWKHVEAGSVAGHVWFDFVVSHSLFGFLAATLAYFIIHALTSEVLLPKLIVPGDIDEAMAERIARLMKRIPWYFAGCTIVPFASVFLMALPSERGGDSGITFQILALMGAVAFGGSLLLSAHCRANLEALSRAVRAPTERFRAPA